ncbi:hypothetical protein ABZ725_48865 [Streptomyces sp. NPDC006872]|uniref:hypothetical protein n=1 Tax=Streptomyces sp. NPDC006872 TaxID=3155720 RepID=UPI0033E0F5E1
MSRHLILVHGRAQQGKDPDTLKAEWLAALAKGLAKSGLSLPIPETAVHFPYYGNTLAAMLDGDSADVVLRGAGADDDERAFTGAVLEEFRRNAGVTDEQILAAADTDVVGRGPLDWSWIRAMALALDRVPGASGTSIALFAHDVYQYLRNSTIREEIESGVVAAFSPGAEVVVVGHSLGSVVTYNLLRREGHLRGWRVPLYVTLGSPLAVLAIRRALKRFQPTRCPPCVDQWFNALDSRDIVALRPLTPGSFPLDPEQPAITNKTDVLNHTENRHGIVGYLDDEEVAQRIHDSLTS